MEPVFDLGLEVTRWLQASYPFLQGFFELISELGREEFYLALLPLVFWCLDKHLGRYLAYLFLVSTASNSLLKGSLRGPRPFWLDNSVQLSDEVSYGVPSGHAQLAATVYALVAAWLNKGWIWFAALLLIILMGLSRIYLGVHFVHDVAVGYLLAFLILVGFAWWRRNTARAFAKRIMGQKLLTATTVPVVFAAIYTAVRLLIGPPDSSVAWAAYVDAAEREGLDGVATGVGALLGAGVGLVLEASRVRFLVQGSIVKRLLRYVLGIVITVGIWAGLKEVFPTDPLWLAIPLRVLRYFLILIWVSYYGPMVFVRLKLAKAEPDPGIDLRM